MFTFHSELFTRFRLASVYLFRMRIPLLQKKNKKKNKKERKKDLPQTGPPRGLYPAYVTFVCIFSSRLFTLHRVIGDLILTQFLHTRLTPQSLKGQPRVIVRQYTMLPKLSFRTALFDMVLSVHLHGVVTVLDRYIPHGNNA